MIPPLTGYELRQTARLIAMTAHAGQRYGRDHDYFTYHVEGVAKLVAHAADFTRLGTTNSNDAVAAAYLHDVLEDTKVNSKLLRAAGINPQVIRWVQLLTRVRGEEYQRYLERIQRGGIPEVTMIKLYDVNFHLEHNGPGFRNRRRYEGALITLTTPSHAANQAV